MERDVSIEYHGSLALLTLNTQEAKDWVNENAEIPSYLWRTGTTFAIEINYLEDLVIGLLHRYF